MNIFTTTVYQEMTSVSFIVNFRFFFKQPAVIVLGFHSLHCCIFLAAGYFWKKISKTLSSTKTADKQLETSW